MATRPNGQELLDAIERVMATVEQVELDFGNRSPTPSFVDQCLGGFVKLHGLSVFKQKIKLTNVAEDVKPLVKHVVLTRASETLHSAHARAARLNDRLDSSFARC
ncbi:MAG: STAS-like domain-containing protein [Hydrogenophaga sp.]|nr:STAS-like domain-containing protein [Hydrogenophaga sp.]